MSGITESFKVIETGYKERDNDFLKDVREGLAADSKHLSCRFFYDKKGSKLFEAICDLPEYYLTRAEREILVDQAKAIAAQMPENVTLVELGSGSGVKTQVLIEALLLQQMSLLYMPVDISSSALEDSAQVFLDRFSNLEIVGVSAEYQRGLREVRERIKGPKLVLWLGSSVGNFTRLDAAQFLRDVRASMRSDDLLLMGVDLRKDRAVLEPAYDDAQGVTAQFNLNLLERINRELGGHFNLDAFQHKAVYDENEGRVEMYLVSTREQVVAIDDLGLGVSFEEGEMVFTELSYKYSLTEIETLAEDSDFELLHQWFDGKKRFSLNLMGGVCQMKCVNDH
ncbi:MAG: L-histidine N(alpha)-methyltransferase [Candidatus Latescibacteria bacterium]|jgi:L-histidine Nalpha-methyltransferase|nr:L-histidine N(alpha)-methyltransferase [Candidatus Latescibacterota bacterium]MBT5829037.1 L-histidine N(alpha)-methyltransferase [Candidatus Latescibacterota bacterium]